ncbi:MAG: hypothetical protein HY823_09075 [Acidobacteria bacterium]|nr:hypothetical protein [Acidobacteriota bacterium]
MSERIDFQVRPSRACAEGRAQALGGAGSPHPSLDRGEALQEEIGTLTEPSGS